jgi:hypothetical protein
MPSSTTPTTEDKRKGRPRYLFALVPHKPRPKYIVVPLLTGKGSRFSRIVTLREAARRSGMSAREIRRLWLATWGFRLEDGR